MCETATWCSYERILISHIRQAGISLLERSHVCEVLSSLRGMEQLCEMRHSNYRIFGRFSARVER